MPPYKLFILRVEVVWEEISIRNLSASSSFSSSRMCRDALPSLSSPSLLSPPMPPEDTTSLIPPPLSVICIPLMSHECVCVCVCVWRIVVVIVI